MDQMQMKERCPDSVLSGKAVLHDYKLEFTIYSPKRKCGCADVVKKPGSKVYGLLYKLTNSDLKKLDGFEGCPNYYRRVTVCVADFSGAEIKAVSYEVADKSKESLSPSTDYLNLLISAAEDFEFPASYIKYLNSYH